MFLAGVGQGRFTHVRQGRLPGRGDCCAHPPACHPAPPHPAGVPGTTAAATAATATAATAAGRRADTDRPQHRQAGLPDPSVLPGAVPGVEVAGPGKRRAAAGKLQRSRQAAALNAGTERPHPEQQLPCAPCQRPQHAGTAGSRSPGWLTAALLHTYSARLSARPTLCTNAPLQVVAEEGYMQFFKMLNQYRTGPYVLRIGGTSTDRQDSVPPDSVWQALARVHREAGGWASD